MFIEQLALENFKCFQQTTIDFSKITLLTGANSSGKSSIIKAILAALQTNDFPFYLSPNGDYVNLGDYSEMVFRNDTTKEIGVSFKLNTEVMPSNRFYDVSAKWVQNNNVMPKLSFLVAKGISPLVKEYTLELKLINNLYKRSITNPPSSETFEKLSDMSPFQKIKMFETFTNLRRDTLFISSFRNQPRRTYYQKAKAGRIDTSGEGYIDQILEWEQQNSDKFNQLIKILNDLKLINTLETNLLQGGRFELRIQTEKDAVPMSLTDVGFGINQFLPIIVGDLQLSNGSTLMIEQPEIHLHPSIQATFGDYLTRQILDNNKHYLIETHSEYLLNRLRLNIVKGELTPDDVAVYYFENTPPNGTKTHKIEFGKDGQIRNAPATFFDTYMVDVMDIALYI